MRGLRNTAIVTLVLALSLILGPTGAQARGHAPTAAHSAVPHRLSPTTKRNKKRAKARRRRARQIAHRSAARKRRHRESHHRIAEPTPEPEPAPEPEPTPAPAPAPAPDSEPEPEPEPEPEAGVRPSGTALFNGDFDAGFRGWYVQSLSSRATLFSSDVFQGTQAARFEVRDGDVEPDTGAERSEVSGPTFDEDQDIYIRDAIRVPSGNSFSAPWQIIEQLHEENWNGSPGIALFLDDGHSLRLGAGDGSPTFWQGPTVQANRWYDLVYRVNLSRSSSTGFVEVWLDGVQQKLLNGQTRVYGQTIQAAQTYLKAGIYRSKSSTGTSIVEHDAIAVGTSYAAIATE